MPLGQFPFELKEVEELNTAALKDANRYAAASVEILAKAGLKHNVFRPIQRHGHLSKGIRIENMKQKEL